MSRKRRAADVVEDVLAGRVRPELHELFELIHAINPTARASDPRERDRDYERKAGLQSLLIRRYGDELRVTAGPDGTIAIDHRYSNRDGCHAQLDALDAEARAWVRWQLDTNEVPPPAATAPAGSSSGRAARVAPASDPLARGRQALDDYDFEAAVALFHEALAASGGDVVAARALLETLVDTLAQDDEALAVEAELAPAAREDNEVQGLLGLAAARAGKPELARRWLQRATGPRPAEAWVVLARDALGAARCEDAERAVGNIEQLDPSHPALLELRAAVVACRADARRPDEEAVQAAMAAGDEDAAEARARAVLARWPDSAVAGRTLARIDERRRARAGAEAQREAIAALGRGDLTRARELAHRAGGLGVEVGELVARIEQALGEAREVREATRVDEVCQVLRDEERRGLEAYAELDGALRARVVTKVVDASLLRWLDELVPAERGRARPAERGAAIEAVLALREAGVAVAAGDPRGALALLDAHAALGELREARTLRTRVHDAVMAHRQGEAAATLDAAIAAWEVRDTATATRLLDGLDRRVLEPAQRDRAERLVAAVRRRTAREARSLRVEAWIARGELLAARRELEAALDQPDEPDELEVRDERAQLDAIRAELRARWRVRSVARSTPGPQQLGELVGAFRRSLAPEPWLTDEGQLVLAVARERHVFVAVSEPAGGGGIVHHVETPAPLGVDLGRCVAGDRLWIAGAREVLQLDWRTGEVVRWESLAPFLEEEAIVESVLFVPATRTMWVESSLRGHEFSVRVVDLERWSVVRTVSGGRHLVSIPGDEPLVGALDYAAGSVLYAGRGRSEGELAELHKRRVAAIVRHPSQAGFVVAASVPDDNAELSLHEVQGGHVSRPLAIPDSNADSISYLLSLRGQGLVFLYAIMAESAELFAIRASSDGLATSSRVAVPDELALAHDAASRRGCVVWEAPDGIHVAALGEPLPTFGPVRERTFPAIAPYFSCGPYGASVFEELAEPIKAGRWDEVRAQLDAVDVASLPAEHREHHHHLLGLARMRTGDAAGARAIWAQGLDVAEPAQRRSCRLDVCLQLVEELDDDAAAGGADEGDDARETIQLRRAIARATACRARGDVSGALAALRARCVYRARERQSRARLADAWLALPEVEGDEAWFDKALALAQFLDVEDLAQFDLPLADAWDEARLAEVASRARAWFAER
jgi:hypothetical protein